MFWILNGNFWLIDFIFFEKMLEDLRSQINQLKVNQDNEMNRMESRLLTKIDENSRNSDRYVSSLFYLKGT